MIFAAGLALLLSSVTENPEQDLLLGVFKSACTQGEVALDPGKTKQVTWSQLPKPFRKHYNNVQESLIVYELQTDMPGYLIFFENKKAKGDDYLRGCAIAAENLDMNYAFRRFEGPDYIDAEHIAPNGEPLNVTGFNMVSPTLDYVIEGKSVFRSYYIIQLSFVGAKQKKRLLKMDAESRASIEQHRKREKSRK